MASAEFGALGPRRGAIVQVASLRSARAPCRGHRGGARRPGAIQLLDRVTFSPERIRAHALTFDTAVFDRRWRELFAAHGVDPALYSVEPALAEIAAASS